jgi:N6-L-threonylcarbamoyladenine synthase
MTLSILAIDTSCDETSAAVTQGTTILSNIIWSQASLHAKWGGVLPSLAQRKHRQRIDWVISRALKAANKKMTDIDAVAVTVGPCLAVAGQVGIQKAKEISIKHHKPFLAVNHLEGHVLSPLALPKSKRLTKKQLPFPAFGLVVSGGHTDLVKIKQIGQYQLLATTQDDALGEALDKAARMLGLGYPGGAILEKMARKGKDNKYSLPLPMSGRESEGRFSYSGLKTAMWKLTESEKKNGFLRKSQIENLAWVFQDKAFEHLIRVIKYQIQKEPAKTLLVGGGVVANTELRKRLRQMVKELNLRVCLPYSKRLCTDNAAMIGVAAYFKAKRGEYEKEINKVERVPRLSLDQTPPWSD